MKSLEKQFNIVKKSKDPEELNDFLIEIGKQPRIEFLSFIDYFIENCDPLLFQQVKLNLIYVLGEVGKLIKIHDNFISFLFKEYNNSDRWVRGEIISAFNKISINVTLSNKIIELLGTALNEEYIPNSINALNALYKLNTLPKTILRNIFNVFNSSNSEIIELSTAVLFKFVKNEEELFESLLQNGNYKILKKNAIRSLLIIYFKSLSSIESFSQKIFESKIESFHKEIFLKEIETYKRILSKVL